MNSYTFLSDYGFDLEAQTPESWCERWSQHFPEDWIPSALLEAFYQGRYKATSVECLLSTWLRRGRPRLSFSPEFSRKIWPNSPRLNLSPTRFKPKNFKLQPDFSNLEPKITSQSLRQDLQDDALPAKLQTLLGESSSLEDTANRNQLESTLSLNTISMDQSEQIHLSD